VLAVTAPEEGGERRVSQKKLVERTMGCKESEKSQYWGEIACQRGKGGEHKLRGVQGGKRSPLEGGYNQ